MWGRQTQRAVLLLLGCLATEFVESIGGKGFNLKFGNTNAIYNRNAAQQTRVAFQNSGAWVRPEFYAFVSIFSILGICWVWRRICRNIATPEMILSNLELDDTPIERFDGIESTLFNRIRDPWGYAPTPTIAISEEELDEIEKRNTDLNDIHDAAQLLKMKNIRESIDNDIEKGQVFASVADQGSPSYAQKLSKFDDDIYDADWKARNEKEKAGKHERLHFKTDNQKAADKEKELMGGAAAEDESDVFRSRKKKDDDYGAMEKKAAEKEGEKEEGKKAGKAKDKEKTGWDAWSEYQNKGGDGDDDDDDSAYEINPVEQVGLSSRSGAGGRGAVEHKEDSYHLSAMIDAVSPGGESNRKLAPPPDAGNNKREDARFAARTGTTRKAGGYKAPTLGARPGTGTGTGSNNAGQFSGRAPPPRTQDNIPSTTNIKAAGGSFSQGSGPLARQDTAREMDGSAALSRKISPEKQKSALQLDLSKVKAAPTSVRPPAMTPAPDAAGDGTGAMSTKNKKPLPQMSLATMTQALPRPAGNNMNTAGEAEDINRPPSSGVNNNGSVPRVVDSSKVAMAPSGIPLPRPGSGSRPASGSNSGNSTHRSSSNNSSRDSNRSSLSREEAKKLNITKGLTLSSFAKKGGAGDDDDGYSMDVRGEIDPLGTRQAPSSPSLVAARGAPPRVNPAVLAAVSAASTKSPGATAPRGAPPRFTPRGPVAGPMGSPPPRGARPMLGPPGMGLTARGPLAAIGRPPPGAPGSMKGMARPPPGGPPPRGGPGPPPGAAPASARAPSQGPRPPPRGPLSGRKDE